MSEQTTSHIPEVPKPKDVKEVLKAKSARTALYGRLLIATEASMDPSVANSTEAIADIKSFQDRDYTLLDTMSIRERSTTAAVPEDQLEAKVTEWVVAQAAYISQDFKKTAMDQSKAALWNTFFRSFATNETEHQLFLKHCYDQYCAVGTSSANTGVKGFVGMLIDRVEHKVLAANLDAVEYLAGMFGADTARIVRAQVEAELVLLTQGDALKNELKSNTAGKDGIRLNQLESDEITLLSMAEKWIKKKPPATTPVPKAESTKTPEERVIELQEKYKDLAVKIVRDLRTVDATNTTEGPYKDMQYNKKYGPDACIQPITSMFSDRLQDALNRMFGVDSMFMITRNLTISTTEPVEKHAKAVFSLPYMKEGHWYVKTWDPANPIVPSTGMVGFIETPLKSDYSVYIDNTGHINRTARDTGGMTFTERLWNDDVFISQSVRKLIQNGTIHKNSHFDLTTVFDQPTIDPIVRQRMMDIVLQGLPDDDVNCIPHSWFATMMLYSIQPNTSNLIMPEAGRTDLEREFGVKLLDYTTLIDATTDKTTS